MIAQLVMNKTRVNYLSQRITFDLVTFPGMLRVFRECGVDGHRLWMDILIQYVNL